MTVTIPTLPASGNTNWYAHYAALDAAARELQGTFTPAVVDDVINVKDYGAVGNGTTDDTAAVIAARNAVLASVNTATGELSKTLYFPAGKYRVTSADCLMHSPATTSTSGVFGLTVRGHSKYGSTIHFDSTATSSADPFANNLMTAANRLIRSRFFNLRFNSTNANQSFIYMYNQSTDEDGNLRPEYGTGHNNQDMIFVDCAWSGPWLRGFGLDGDWAANLNSEISFYNCHLNNAAAFGDAFFHSGITKATSTGTDPAGFTMTSGDGYVQQDQFLNYTFFDCKMELDTGDVIKMDKGGSVRVFGGSWIMLGATATGSMFTMADESHTDSVMNLTVVGTRFELKTATAKLLDTAWSGRRAHIMFDNCSLSSQAFRSWSAESEVVSLRGHVDSTGAHALPQVSFRQCDLMGYAKVYTTTAEPQGGTLVYEQCNWSPPSPATGTWLAGIVYTPRASRSFPYTGVTAAAVRYPSGMQVPWVAFIRCSGINTYEN